MTETQKRAPETGRTMTRATAMAPTTYDAETHSVEVVIATDVALNRGYYIEILNIDADSVDLGRAAAGQVKALDCHNAYSMDELIGTVSDVRIEGRQVVGKITFAQTEEGQMAEGMVARGELTGVSAGYRVQQWTITEDLKIDTYTATRWELLEVSFTPVPADPASGVRSLKAASHTREKEPTMSDKPDGAAVTTQPENTRTVETAPTAQVAPVVEQRAAVPDTEAVRKEGAAAERKRITEIRSICEGLNIPGEMAQRFIDDGIGLEAVRSAVIDYQVQHSAARSIVGGGASAGVTVTNPGVAPTEKRDAMAEALFRAMPGADAAVLYGKRADAKPSDRVAQMAGEYRGLGLIDLAREYHGLSYRMERSAVYDEIVKRAALGTSDFPLLLSAAANKFLLQQYTYQDPNYRRIAQRFQFRDFKEHKILRVGDMSRLEQLPENGEVKQGAGPSERQNVLYAKTYGIIHKFTRQMYINDDINAFADMASAAGRGALEDENYLAWQIILANSGAGPTLADGKAVFHSGHNNVGTAADINVASLGEARKLMRVQKSVDGRPLSGNVPTIILAGPTKETVLDQILSTNMLATQFSNIVPNGMQRLTPVIDAYITDNSWYVFADPAWRPTFRWGYVDGFEGPRFTMDQPFNYDGLSLKVMLDFGFGAVDYVGAVRNAGA